ncbi:ABC transporter substrate-binding protein [Mesorhizobium australicum]|uniref:Putative spermidine/putrescine transport system substrate-binding protein n=1 Tax=Mesorhizobium australicum TaxID=536018 RepID=A0A1X7MXR8_9HYPH|nr:ABC transporter substrate-binding protein [Mesorhizobium australicum]SMH29669.1 putative spermidine/putrescine transport system substrate-binding protein [Mesorhizobium australicum]
MSYAMNRRQVLRASAALGSLAAMGAASGMLSPRVAAAAGQLVITSYGGRYERFWRETLLPPFEQATGTEAVVDVGLGVNWAANLRASGPEKPAYSYVMMNELVGALLRQEGFFKQWPAQKVPNLAKVHPKAVVGDGMGVTAMVSPIGIAYRTDLVKAPPKSWKDLWDNEEFKGKIGLFQISNTAGYMFLMMISQIYGSNALDFDAGFAQIEKLVPFPTGDLAGALAILLTRGEIAACPLDLGETINMQKKGAPVAFIAPEEGMFMFDQTFDLLRAAPNEDAACAFLDHVLSEEMQVKLAEEFSYIPVNTSTVLPEELAKSLMFTANDLDKIVSFDWIEANKVRDQVTERWNRTVR